MRQQAHEEAYGMKLGCPISLLLLIEPAASAHEPSQRMQDIAGDASH